MMVGTQMKLGTFEQMTVSTFNNPDVTVEIDFLRGTAGHDVIVTNNYGDELINEYISMVIVT